MNARGKPTSRDLSRTLSSQQLRQARGKRFEFSPARSPLPSASGGLWALGCVGERRRSVRRCRLGTRVRVSVPGGVVEAVAVAPWRNKSSRTLPRPVGASLRRRRRARGGKSPFVESLFRSSSAAARCLWGAMGRRLLFPRCGVGCWFCGRWEVGSGSFPSRRSAAAVSSGPRSRVLGAWPRLMDFSATALSHSQGRVSTSASFKAFVRWSTLRSGFGRWRSEAAFPGDGNDAVSAYKGSRDLDLIFFFLRPFVLVRLYCCTPYSCTVYLYLYWYLYIFLN